jgi:hypothetical protein
MSYSKTKDEETRDKQAYKVTRTETPAEEQEELRRMNEI